MNDDDNSIDNNIKRNSNNDSSSSSNNITNDIYRGRVAVHFRLRNTKSPQYLKKIEQARNMYMYNTIN